MSHKKIMKKCAKSLEKDAKNYAHEAGVSKSPVKKLHERIEQKEAKGAAKKIKKMAKKSHDY